MLFISFFNTYFPCIIHFIIFILSKVILIAAGCVEQSCWVHCIPSVSSLPFSRSALLNSCDTHSLRTHAHTQYILHSDISDLSEQTQLSVHMQLFKELLGVKDLKCLLGQRGSAFLVLLSSLTGLFHP